MNTHLVTGAFSFTGRHLAARLLQSGVRVKTLTHHPDRPNPFGSPIETHPYAFDQPDRMARFLEGIEVVYNTYWVRFDRRGTRHDRAVENSRALFQAARRAGVQRFVHISITNPSADSPLTYFRGKAEVEKILRESGLSYAILRPAVLFGDSGILINNIAWLLRKFPLFGVIGDGAYQLQPIYVEDLAQAMIDAGQHRDSSSRDAVGPETFRYIDLVRLIREAVGSHARLISVPPIVARFVGALLGRWVGDVVVTRDEIIGLMANLLVSKEPPLGPTRLSEWIRAHRETLGRKYFSELAAHYDREDR